VRVFGPEGVPPIASSDELSQLAQHEDGLMFELAWLSDTGTGEHWLLLNDVLAEDLTRKALDEQARAPLPNTQ